jgi:hypothetical protein
VPKNNSYNKAKILQFLLSEMPEDERIAFEESFVADEDLFEQIRVGEDELIESYVRGTLASPERENFEKLFLSTEKRRERVRFTRAMLSNISGHQEIAAVKKIETTTAHPSAWDSITNFFKTQKLAFGAGLTLLLIIFGALFLLRSSTRKETGIARQITPTPSVSVSPVRQANENNSNTILSENTTTNEMPANNVGKHSNENQNIPNSGEHEKEVASPNSVIVTLALFAGTTRSEGKTGELNLPKGAKGANLQLKLESQDYKTYRADLVNADGKVIYRSGRLNPKNAKVSIFAPAGKLPAGDYIIKLYGFTSQTQEESAADYQFRVVRK